MILAVIVEERQQDCLDMGQRQKGFQTTVGPWGPASGWMVLLCWQCGTEGSLSSQVESVF